MRTPDYVPAFSSAEVTQAAVHLGLGVAAVDRLLRRWGAGPEHLELAMVLTELSQATHLALVRLAEAQEVHGSVSLPTPTSIISTPTMAENGGRVSATPTDVRNDTTASRFVVAEDGVEAKLLYRRRADRLILIHTDVPEELGGRGIGARLVRAAIAYAREEHLTVVPWCPFARRWLRDHPDEAQGLPIDWDTQPPPGAGTAGRP